MEYDVEILNLNTFEKDGVKKTRIGYRLLDPKTISNTDKFKGYADLNVFLNNTIAFDKINADICGKHVKFVFIEKPNPTNPMKKSVTLSKILSEKNEDLCVLE